MSAERWWGCWDSNPDAVKHIILSLAHRLRKPPLVVDFPYKSSALYRFPPSMFVGVGGSVGGKAPSMGGYIGPRPPIYIVVIVGTDVVEYSRTFWDTPCGRPTPFRY